MTWSFYSHAHRCLSKSTLGLREGSCPSRALQWNSTFWRTKIPIFVQFLLLAAPLSLVYIVINLKPDVFICQGQCSPWKSNRQEEPKDPGCAGTSGSIPTSSAESAVLKVVLYPKTPPVLWQYHTSEPGYFNPFFSLSRPDRPFKGQAFNYNIYRIFMIIFILQ